MTKPEKLIPQTLILNTTFERKEQYCLLKEEGLSERFALDLAKNLRKKHGWRVKVKLFDGLYYLYYNKV